MTFSSKNFSYKKIHILLFFLIFVCVFMFFGGQRKKSLHSWLKLRKRVDIPQRVSFTFGPLLLIFSFSRPFREREKSDHAKKIEIFSPNLDVNTPKPPPNASALEHLPVFIGRRPMYFPSSIYLSRPRRLFKPLFSSLSRLFPLPPWLNSRGFGVFIDNVERVRFGVLGYAPRQPKL